METTINQRIANLRKIKGLTQKQFAKELNVSDKLVSKWEQGDSAPALEDVISISKKFNLTLDYLINGKESATDIEALKPAPPPLPAFVDPIHTLVKKIDDLINKNKLQKYKEQLFPSSSKNLLYEIAERVRKATLEDWEHIEWAEENELITGGYKCYIYRGDYIKDRRGPKNLIDEKYWAQVDTVGDYRRVEHISKSDKDLLKSGFGIFIIDDFGCSRIKKISNNDEFKLIDYDISFSINFNALLALDNYEIYSKITSLSIPLFMQVLASEQVKKSSGYFNLTFEEIKYYEIFEKMDLKYPLSNTIRSYLDCLRGKSYNNRWRINKPKSLKDFYPEVKNEYVVRNLEKVPLTYTELLSLTDIQFFSLLSKDELDILLENINPKNKRVWEIILTLIDSGATKKKLIKVYSDCVIEVDTLTTLMLQELAKMKLQNKE